MDDEWFWVFTAGVLWKAYQWGDDGRAGSASMDSSGKTQYSGQLAIFQDSLQRMAEREKLSLVEPNDLVNPKETKK
jgi:hypothetical protein